MNFVLKSKFSPTGDQPQAIKQLVAGVNQSKPHQTLLGVTGSGKTFTMANVIAQTQKPTLIVAHNKTLAAQLYQEFRDFFPNNAVSYFVSYYDYYQPEAYIPTTDTYIEKETQINDEIDKLRLSTTTNLLTRSDVIVVASVSCLYNLGSPIEYGKYVLEIIKGQLLERRDLLLRLNQLQYERTTTDLKRGTYRLKGDIIQLWPAYEEKALKIDTLEDEITDIDWIDPISGSPIDPQLLTNYEQKQTTFVIYPAKHYLINPKSQQAAFEEILADLKKQVSLFKNTGKMFEAHRIEQRVKYDLQMMREFGFVNGIENYSRYFDGRHPGQPPFTLLDYFHQNALDFGHNSFLTIIDESHMTIPQIKGMHAGDQARKQNLIDYGFRLPSALDNRPLKLAEFMALTPQVVYVSATPKEWEIQKSGEVIEQLIRPTGLVDPEIEVRSAQGQIEDLIKEVIKRQEKGQRTLVTTLTKKMAEALTDYLNNPQKIDQLLGHSPTKYPQVAYLHSDIDTMERSDILDELRLGKYDVLVGINLLREGLDLPEVTLVAILDADKEGFLRSKISLIQTMGRAARHVEGKAIMYADKMTDSMKIAIKETSRRRQVQLKHNQKHQINPQTIIKPIRQRMVKKQSAQDKEQHHWQQLDSYQADDLTPQDKKLAAKELRQLMNQAAKEMNFELAAALRDKISELV